MTSQRSVSHTPAYEHPAVLDPRLVATIASANLILAASNEIRSMLTSWAQYCIGGRTTAIVLPSRESARRAYDAVDPFWTVLHVERFFDIPGNIVFREYALTAYGKLVTPEDALKRWQWKQPGEPAFEAYLRHGWARVGVRDIEDPLPELIKEFGRRMLAWHIANPMPLYTGLIEEQLGDTQSDGNDLDRRLVSVRTACILLESWRLHDRIESILRHVEKSRVRLARPGTVRNRLFVLEWDRRERVPERTVRYWCSQGKLESAIMRPGESGWLIRAGDLRNFEAQGKKSKKVRKTLISGSKCV